MRKRDENLLFGPEPGRGSGPRPSAGAAPARPDDRPPPSAPAPSRWGRTRLGGLFAWVLGIVLIGYLSVLTTWLSNAPIVKFRHLAPLCVFVAALAVTGLVLRLAKYGGDGPLVALVMLLSGLGLVLQLRIGTLRMDPDARLSSFAFPLGVAAMLGTWAVFRKGRARRLEPAWMGCWIASLVVVLAVLALGRRYRGAVYMRGNMNPVEVVKPLLVVFTAAVLTGHREALRRGWWIFPWPKWKAVGTFAMLWSVPVLLLLVQGDIGLVTLLCLVALAMLYGISRRAGYILLGGGAVFVLARFVIPHVGHAAARFAAWRDPFSVATTSGWQILQGLVALYSGGLWGVGVGGGDPAAVPISESDFIYAVIGEELGYVGCGLVMLLYLALAARGFGVAARAKSAFTGSLATGLTGCVLFQALMNMGGVAKAIPLTGITLPYVSHGGSSLVAFFVVAGLLMAVSEE